MNIFTHTEDKVTELITAFDSTYNFLDKFELKEWQTLPFPYIYMAISDKRPDNGSYEASDGKVIDSELVVDMYVGQKVGFASGKTPKEVMYDAIEALDLGLNAKSIDTLTVSGVYVTTFKPIKIELVHMKNFSIKGKTLFEFPISVPFKRCLI